MKRKKPKPTIRGLQRRVRELETQVRSLTTRNWGLSRDVEQLARLGDEPLSCLRSRSPDGVESAWTRDNAKRGECPLCDSRLTDHACEFAAKTPSEIVLVCPC